MNQNEINPPKREQWKVWSKVALHSFGGPAGQIAVIHKLVVEDKKIISEERFLHALNFCMLLPGPEAQQLATYMGWLMGRWQGGLIAGGLFVLPGFLSILLLSFMYVAYNDFLLVQGIFYGMKPAIIAIVTAALLRISKKSLKGSFYWFMALFAFVAIFFINLPFPLVVISAAIMGALHGKFIEHHKLLSDVPEVRLPSHRSSLLTFTIWALVWAAPIILVLMIFGPTSTFHALNIFFSKMSMVTFGGAYAALSYVAQRAVEDYGWLQGSEMLDGLGMAETTPGPLIQVVQFVGFMGAYRFPDLSSPYASALLGSILTTWMTFAPCFLWIFLFAPYVEYIRGQKVFSDALRAITAAVVGVIFNLSVWFVMQVLFPHRGVEWPAAFICGIALLLQFQFKQGLFTILGVSTLLGILIKLFGA